MIQAQIKLFSIFLVFIFASSLVSAATLQNHPSPYLRLHASDPVNWQSWGKDVLERAQAENKLIYLSIGYFSCHWCHVMQKESYKDQQVGDLLNKNYIAVKVDRELRPELDRRMIRFVEEVTGSAGWPLNVFLTPEGYPVTGFTYLPRDRFYQVLNELDQKWQQEYTEIKPVARAYFKQTEFSEARTTQLTLPDQHYAKVVDSFVAQAMGIADELQGGFGDSNKFPSFPQFKALLAAVRDNPDIDDDVPAFLRLTLDNMSRLNLMDQVNHGFFRYTTDPDWHTPHYEKMLYDNAQLVLLYLQAEQLWPRQGYAEVALKTIGFMQNFLADEQGGYYSSLSAVDVDNNEGAAYLWTLSELEKILSQKEIAALQTAKKILLDKRQSFQIPSLLNSTIDPKMQQSIMSKLRQAERPEMPLDDKKLASWNALVLLGLLKAEEQQPDKELSRLVEKQYKFITTHFVDGNRVMRFPVQTQSSAQSSETTLEDYAYVTHAVALYAQLKNNKSAAALAVELAEATYARFYLSQRWIQDSESLIPGNTGDYVIQDAVLESPVTVLLEGVLMLNDVDKKLQNQTQQLIKRLTRDMLDVPYYYASAIMLRNNYQSTSMGNKEIGQSPDNS